MGKVMNRFSNNIGGKLKFRLITLVFLEYAVWGAYLISIGRYLAQAGLGSQIKWFFATNGIVSLFMPALVGIIADRYIQAQRLLAVCHLLAGALMLSAGIYCLGTDQVMFDSLYPLYALSILFFMPTVALTNSVSYSIITRAGGDPVKDYPPIRLFGTVGFICSMLAVNFIKIGGVQMQDSYTQLIMSGVISLILCIYSLTLPECPTGGKRAERSVAEAFGISAFRLFGQRHMAVFFVFCILMGSALQITNGYANTFLSSFSVCSQELERSAFTVADIGDTLLPACSFLHETVRNKEGAAHVHDCMGTQVRPVRYRHSRYARRSAVHIELHSVRNRFRFLQYRRFSLCGAEC